LGKRIIISPLTRVNGFWRVDVEVEQGKVVDAWSSGSFFRGMEAILTGRAPKDAPYLTERICGICSTAHAAAAVKALERLARPELPHNTALLRNLIYGADLLQNHTRQFYLLAAPAFVEMPEQPPWVPRFRNDARLSEAQNQRFFDNYLESIEISRLTHEMATIFGGKAPHTHGITAGGATVGPTADRIRRFGSMLRRVKGFIETAYLPDFQTIAAAYPDYFEIGRGHGNLLSTGVFSKTSELDSEPVIPGGVILNGSREDLDTAVITEEVRRAWYRLSGNNKHPFQGVTDPDFPGRDEAYSWIKAPRYRGLPAETGPLASLILAGKWDGGISTLDRMGARGQEALLAAELMLKWLEELDPAQPHAVPVDDIPDGEAFGLWGAMRGSLGHWIRVSGGRISHYQIVTPSAWNCSPRDEAGIRGPIEEALIGTPLPDIDNPVQVGRVVRSFDPCLSCACHIIEGKKEVTVDI